MQDICRTALRLLTDAGRGPRRWYAPIAISKPRASTAAGADALGDYCYRTTITLGAADAGGTLHLLFPGLFNEAWLSINGIPVAHRSFKEPWWTGDYRFDWDVDLSGRLSPGAHVVTLGGFDPLHYAALFRRPFLYQPIG